MSANISQRRRRVAVLRTGLAELRDAQLELHCSRCRRTLHLPLSRFSQAAVVADVVARLRCSRCALPPARVILQGRRGWGVRLVGPGALS